MKQKQNAKYYLAGSISLITFTVFLTSLKNEFLQWDDDHYVFENHHIRSLDPAFFKWAFFDFHAGNWHPFTWLSHALDYAVWGLNPLGHHLTNNILHAVNTFIVVLLVVRLLEIGNNFIISPDPSFSKRGNDLSPPLKKGDKGGFSNKSLLISAGVAGFLFGLHPVHVESVAWVSERKDLLCALFFLLSIMAYMTYVTPPSPSYDKRGWRSRGSYLLTFLFFILALFSKPMAVTLPVVLLILDWFPLERMRSMKAFRGALVEKLPFIALSLASSVLTVLAQRSGGAVRSMEFAPFGTRVLVAGKSLMAYLWKMVLPLDLIPLYPYPGEASFISLEYLPAFALAGGITITGIVLAKKQKLWLSVWGYYVITLLPVLGIVQVGLQSMADRYTYLPSLGPFLVMGLMAAWVWERIQGLERQKLMAKSLAVGVSVIAVVSLSYLTFKQVGIWKNSIVLWSYVIEKEPEKVPFAYYNRGLAYEKTGLPDKAIADYDRAIALNPSFYEALNNRGLVFQKMGLLDKAVNDLEAAIEMKPSPAAYDNLGKIYSKTGRFDKAIENYNKAIALNPAYHEAYYNRAIVHEKMGQPEAAIESYNDAIALNPSYYEAYNNLGILYANAALYDKAIEQFTRAILLNQSQAVVYLNRGTLYYRTGNKELAVPDFQKACDLGSKAGCSALDVLMRGQGK